MYLNHFGFTEAPFSIAPDPHFLYLGQRHQEALAHLLYGISGDGGFVLLTGEVGSGKTTICRCLLEQVPENCDIAYIFNPRLTVEELLSTICDEIGIPYPAGNTSVKVFIDAINAHLLAAHANGRHTVLIIDEAQNLSGEVLEQMRLLTNLETNQRKLLQIILIGQPELESLLARHELRQLSQRIIARYHLEPLSRAEIAAYVRHRLEVAGGKSYQIGEALSAVLYRLSGGVPRVINVLCDRALLGAYAQDKDRVDKKTLTQAAREVLPRRAATPVRWQTYLVPSAGVAAALGFATALALHSAPEAPAPAPHKTEAPIAPAVPMVTAESTETPPPVLVKTSASRSLAETALLKAWGVVGQTGKSLCRQAEAEELRCYFNHGKLEDLQFLNRPAMLQLRAVDGREYTATLLALGERHARIAQGENVLSLSRESLQQQMTGAYTILWRPPAFVRNTLRAGDRGPGVAWLNAQLSAFLGQSGNPANSAVFDADTLKTLKTFQASRGLAADGNAGPVTVMYLSSLGESDAPKLILPTPRSLDLKPALALEHDATPEH